MAIPETLCVDEDVFNAAGGEANVAQLLDKDGDGKVDANLLLSARKQAAIEVLAAVEVGTQIDGVTAPYPRLWVFCSSWLAVLNVWLSGAQGQAFPSKYQAEVDQVRTVHLPLIRAGKTGAVATQGISLNQSMRHVTHNSPFTLERTKGLW